MRPIKALSYLFILSLFCSSLSIGAAESEFNWPKGAKAAIVLTYDDTLDSHLDIVLPQLNKAKLPGTFYISGARGDIQARMSEWRAAAKKGHELANHTLFHPCRKTKGREWVLDEYDMIGYTLDQFVNELKVTNTLLQAMDGETVRTFAYTCGDIHVGKDTSIINAIKPHVIAARAVTPDGFNSPLAMNYYEIRSEDMTNKTGEELIALAKQAAKNNQLMVYLFHGVGADYLSVTGEAHQALVNHLKKQSKDYWVTTLKEAVIYTKNNNK